MTSSLGGTRRRPLRAAVASLSTAALALAGIAAVGAAPAQAATIPTSVCASKAPVLTSVAIAPRSVDVRKASKSVTITIKATGTAPITGIGSSLDGPKKKTSVYGFFRKVAGTTTNGTWKGTFIVPRWGEKGTYSLSSISLNDANGSYANYRPTGTGYSSSGDTHWGGWPSTVAVNSTPDLVVPTVSKLTMSTKSVNTATKTAKVSFTAIITDKLSGASNAYVTLTSGAPRYGYASAILTKNKKVKNGFTGTAIIPKWVGAGKHSWKLYLNAYDKAGNAKRFTTAQLAAKKWPSALAVTSKTDTANPALAALTVSPTSVDSRSAAKKLNVSMRVTDSQSGVSYGYVTLKPPTGYGTQSSYMSTISGSLTNRTLRGTIEIPRCIQPGTWAVSVTIYDVWGHRVEVSSATLKARGLPSAVKITSIDTTPPTITAPNSIAAGAALTLTFDKPALFKNPIGSTLEVNGGFTPGTWVCKNSANTAVVCDANNANVKTATFTPTTPTESGDTLSVDTVNYPSGIFDTTGNELQSFYTTVDVT